MFRTLQSKLFTSFLLFTLFCILILFYRGFISQKKDNIRQAQHLLHCHTESNLRKFKAVADFFSFETRNMAYFNTGQSPILLQIDSLNDCIYKEIGKIQENKELIDDDTLKSNLNSNFLLIDILRQTNQYVSAFNEITQLIFKRGRGEFGYIGLMRLNLLQLEKNSKLDLSQILTLKRIQKDYMSLFETRLIDSLKNSSEEIKKSITLNPKLSKIEKDSSLYYLNNYCAYFDTLTIIDKQIGIKDNSALYLQINQIEKILQSDFEKLLTITFVKQNELIKKLNISFWGISFFLIISSIFLSYFLSKRITKPLSQLAGSCKTFIESNYKINTKCEIETHDTEITEFAKDINILKAEIEFLRNNNAFENRTKAENTKNIDQVE